MMEFSIALKCRVPKSGLGVLKGSGFVKFAQPLVAARQGHGPAHARPLEAIVLAGVASPARFVSYVFNTLIFI